MLGTAGKAPSPCPSRCKKAFPWDFGKGGESKFSSASAPGAVHFIRAAY